MLETHLYFNSDFNQMIEVLINKNLGSQGTYNLYHMESALTQKWKFISTISSPENPNPKAEWH